MKFYTAATALAILSLVSAETFYVTQTHVVTVAADGQAETAQAPAAQTQPAQAPVQALAQQNSPLVEATSVTAQPTTLVTQTSSSDASTSTGDNISGDGVDQAFAKDILDAHNKKRTAHLAPALKWSLTLYSYAQDYANKYDCSGSLTHSGGKYGENLAVGYSSGDSAVTAWYDEGKGFNYNSGSVLDHFTQVVWKDTTQLGCAYKDCSAENWGKYVICSYDPAGNVVGEVLQNVLGN